ncbi:hypothetical protein PMAYCL1PPCAC_28780 [Pristionchus mayeri]|uniref:DUF1907 domain-containing protein n=1 Tax=Pristionchus mayeri TaxID=1317129 RepID=A0AAN5DAH5_9BILA|nr:hypothetical protein PMAYCL1PPCAC_28780 [Pristionchus mayeri]
MYRYDRSSIDTNSRHLFLIDLSSRMSVDCSGNLSTRLETFVPSLEALADAFRSNLPGNFETVDVDIVECPDLSSPPFLLSSPGFGKNLVIAEVGGPGNLFPTIHREKAFDVTKICSTCEQPQAFAFGPGAGPWPLVGVNCEMVADVNCATKKVGTRTAKIVGGSYKLEQIESPSFSLMANLAVSEAERGQRVVHIKAKKRTGKTNFPESLRQSIVKEFEGKLVSLGGFFILHSGKAKMHVMPDFPVSCFATEEEIGSEWLRYFEMSAPLVCATVMHSNDGNGHKLRVEHTHCYSSHGDGGHYHYDTTPDEVEYEGWFAPASAVYRIDEI